MQEWATAAQNDPTNAASYYFNEGAVLTNTGKLDEAIAAFDKALQADPTRADAYYWKGVDLMGKATTKGDKMVAPEGTAEAFNKYLELAPTGKYADPAKQMLASIGASVETSYGKRRRLPRRNRDRRAVRSRRAATRRPVLLASLSLIVIPVEDFSPSGGACFCDLCSSS